MATSTTPLLLLLVVSAAALFPVQTTAADNATTHLSFFMHDITSGANPTAVKVIKGPGSTLTAPTVLGMTAFGDTTVIDDPVTSTSSPTSAELGRMQGIYMLASQSEAALMVCANLLLTSGAHNGSTLQLMGRDDTGEDVREIPVVGGTGTFRMATGYVLWKTPEGISGTDGTVQLDVYVTTDGNGVDALAPAPGGADEGGSSSGGAAGSGGSKSSSGAARMTAGGWVVAVVVAVVGSSWVW